MSAEGLHFRSTEEEFSRLLSWARYLYWADLNRRAFDDLMADSNDLWAGDDRARFFALMSQWYASLWVVIEGWRALGARDNFIDGLLSHQPEYCDLLRRYRNGVFHFQPDFLDSRFLTLLREGPGPVEWIQALHFEFLRFLWEWPYHAVSARTHAAELRRELREALGWFAEDATVAELSRLETEARKAEAMVASADDSANPHTLELRAAADDLRRAVYDARRKYFTERQTYITRRWVPTTGP